MVGEEVESVAAMVVDVDGLLLARSNVAIICGGCQKSCLVEELCSRGVALVNVGIGSYCVSEEIEGGAICPLMNTRTFLSDNKCPLLKQYMF